MLTIVHGCMVDLWKTVCVLRVGSRPRLKARHGDFCRPPRGVCYFGVQL